MKTYIIGLSCLFCFYSLMAQEKKSFTEVEYKRLCNVLSQDSSTVSMSDNSDILKLNNEIYLILQSPVDVIAGSDDILYNRPQGFSPGLNLRKRYVLEFQLENNILYITDIQLARDYNPENNQGKMVIKEIEKLLGKKRKN